MAGYGNFGEDSAGGFVEEGCELEAFVLKY